MKRKKLLIAVICVALTVALLITAVAVTKYKYTSASGSEVIKTVNRVNITVTDTEFFFEDIGSDGMLSCDTTVTIEKTESDFYGVLNSMTLSGQQFGYTLYSPGSGNGELSVLPENIELTSASDKETKPLEWHVSFTVPYVEGQKSYDVSLDLIYTTGVKPNVTQQYKTSFPITITVK